MESNCFHTASQQGKIAFHCICQNKAAETTYSSAHVPGSPSGSLWIKIEKLSSTLIVILLLGISCCKKPSMPWIEELQGTIHGLENECFFDPLVHFLHVYQSGRVDYRDNFSVNRFATQHQKYGREVRITQQMGAKFLLR